MGVEGKDAVNGWMLTNPSVLRHCGTEVTRREVVGPGLRGELRRGRSASKSRAGTAMARGENPDATGQSALVLRGFYGAVRPEPGPGCRGM